LPPFAVTCLKCSPRDLDFLNKHPKLYHHKLFQWALAVKIRDKNDCRICVALNWQMQPRRKGEIQAHHIFPLDLFPELQFLMDNGITLCELHHQTLHHKQFNKIKKIVLKFGNIDNPFENFEKSLIL